MSPSERAPLLTYDSVSNQLQVSIAVEKDGKTENVDIKSNAKLIYRKWYTVTVGYSEGYLLLYVNGVLDTANDISPYKLKNNELNLVIGNNDYDCNFGIKNFEIYNRLLKSTEVEAKSAVSFY